MHDEYRLKKVTLSDIDFLYQLLTERKSIERISHKTMPTKLQHKNFIKSNLYDKWYIILRDNIKIGSIYLTKINEIGIWVKKGHSKKIVWKSCLKIIFEKHPRKKYLVNINPKNKKFISFWKQNKFRLIQHTYEFIKEN